jgi:hypothetical protein
MKTKPIHEIRIGALRAAVWKNDTRIGARYNVTFSRLYKEGDEWRTSDSFGRDELLLLAKVADRAHSWIYDQPRESASDEPDPSTDNG